MFTYKCNPLITVWSWYRTLRLKKKWLIMLMMNKIKKKLKKNGSRASRPFKSNNFIILFHRDQRPFFQKSLESIMIQFFRELTVKHPCSIKYVYIYVIEWLSLVAVLIYLFLICVLRFWPCEINKKTIVFDLQKRNPVRGSKYTFNNSWALTFLM